MNGESLHPGMAQFVPAGSQQIDINLIVNIHNYLCNVKDPSPTIIEAKTHLEMQLCNMIKGLVITVGVVHGQRPDA